MTNGKKREAGAVLPLVAGALVLLMGLAAFATDLGWFYVNAIRIQRAADAAALAGVIHLPNDSALATAVAHDVAGANGYIDGTDNAVVVPVPQPSGELHHLEVTVTDTVQTFFMRVFGMDTQTISREATAEYLPPLPLGSPDNCFGNDPVGSGDCPPNPNFWANIHGRHTDTRMGDAFSSYCDDGQGSSQSGGDGSCVQNPTHRERGYLFGIEAPAGNFSVHVLDGMFRNESGGFPNGDPIRTGDHNNFCSDPQCVAPLAGPTTTFRLYEPDETPLILDNNLICTFNFDPAAQVDAAAPWDPTDWVNICNVGGAQPGIYQLQVLMDGFGSYDDGLNRYSLKVTPGSSKLYGLGDISIFNNSTGTLTDFYLAEVADVYRGKTLVVELYDPGEANPGGNVQIMEPTGATTWGTFPGCDMWVRPSVTAPWTYRGFQPTCEFFANNSGGADDYNGDWIRLEIDLPDTYSCPAANCWWKVNYDYGGATVSDTTTWRVFVVGNPVHIVP